MQVSVRVSWLAATTLVVLPIVLLLAGAFLAVGGGDQNVQAAEGQGNVDCDGGIDSRDVVILLGVVSGTRGGPRNCVDYYGYNSHECVPPSIPNPTACDQVWPNWITIAPGESVPDRFDVDCDGNANLFDVLSLLLYTVGLSEPLPACQPTGSPD